MNTGQAKQLSLPNLLSKLGHSPVRERKGGNELWYCSPFREEKEPSFHTSFIGGKWIWNDFGDTGGTVIDFAMRYLQQSGKPTSIKDALAFLSDLYQPGLFSSPPPRPKPQPKPDPDPDLFSFQQQPDREAVENFLEDRQLELIDVQPLRHFVILKYLTEERQIPADLAQRYLRLVRYRNNGKEYFAFGMENQAGGWEIRAASSKHNFKSALKARDITIIPGSDPTSASVFEGMTDFLSLLTMMGQGSLPGDAIIMHSLSSYRRAADAIQARGYDNIKTYLDNNGPGQETTERFKTDFGQKVFSQSHTFSPHIDLNDALRALQAQRKPSSNFRT